MFQKIFFVSLQYINCIAFTVYMFYCIFKRLPRRIGEIFISNGLDELSEHTRKEVEDRQWRQFDKEVSKPFWLSFLFLGISMLGTYLDGFSCLKYAKVITIIVVFYALVLGRIVTKYFVSLIATQKDGVYPRNGRQWDSLINSVIGDHAVVLGQTLYATVCLIML